MKRKLILPVFILCFFSSLTAFTKADTIYYNRYDQKVATRQGAHYFRVYKELKNGSGVVNDFLRNGTKIMSGQYTGDTAHTWTGKFISYDSVGIKHTEKYYDNDKLEGALTEFRPGDSTRIWFVQHFHEGQRHGSCKSYYPGGKLKRDEVFDRGKLVTGKRYSEDGREMAYTPFEIQPQFPSDLGKFLSQNIVYPKECIKKDISGKVIVKFVVDEEGAVRNAVVIQSVDALLDAEAIRVIRAMPQWKPGITDDVPVKVYHTLPIKFTLK